MTEAEVAAFQRALAEPPQTGKDLAKALVKRGRLTKFQAQRIFQGQYQGLVLGEYFILDTLGAGGMGQVYLAEHRRMGRRVAVKTLPASVAQNPQVIQRFQREVRAAAKPSVGRMENGAANPERVRTNRKRKSKAMVWRFRKKTA